jgi:hypothetical protein
MNTPIPRQRKAGHSGRGMFARSDITAAAEEFVKVSLDSLGLIWHDEDIEAEANALTDRAFGWQRDKEGDDQ